MSESLPQNNFPAPVLAEPNTLEAGFGEAREGINVPSPSKFGNFRGGENSLDDGYTEFGFKHEPL